MWKMAIIDDEAIIRRGIRNALDWQGIGIEIVGEAEDGETGIKLCEDKRPDILLVDICMPFINGLDMIKAVSDIIPDAVIFIISGHGEFEYAREAIKLDVFDFILKPVDEEYLEQRIRTVINKLNNKKKTTGLKKLKGGKKNFYLARKALFAKIINGESEDNIDYKLKYYDLEFPNRFGIMVIKAIKIDSFSDSLVYNEFLIHTQNIIVDYIISTSFSNLDASIVCEVDNVIVAVFPLAESAEWEQLCDNIQAELSEKMSSSRIVISSAVHQGIAGIASVYRELLDKVEKECQYSQIVYIAKQYIDQNYSKKDLGLNEVADVVGSNPSYLSKLLKKELQSSFIDYLTKVRISNAMLLMNESLLRINEVADKVGYSTQHYFCAAFKKVIGVSPSLYRSRGGQER